MPNTLIRDRMNRRVALGVVLLVGCMCTAACGQSTSTTVGSEGTQVVTQTTQTLTEITPISGTKTPAATVSPGPVRLILGQSQFHPGDLVTVTVENGLSHGITATDHRSNCTVIQLQRLVDSSWQPVDKCNALTPTKMVEVAAGNSLQQRVGIPTGAEAAGTYRMMLTYGASDQQPNNAGPAYSSTFTVN